MSSRIEDPQPIMRYDDFGRAIPERSRTRSRSPLHRRRRSFSRSRSRSRGRVYERRPRSSRSRSPRHRIRPRRSRSRSPGPYNRRHTAPPMRRGPYFDVAPMRPPMPRPSPSRITLDGPLVSFKAFMNSMSDLPVSICEAKYEIYRNDYINKQDREFFDLYSGDEWMKERYNPVTVLERTLKDEESLLQRQSKFEDDFHNGEIEEVNYDIDEGEGVVVVSEQAPESEEQKMEDESVVEEKTEVNDDNSVVAVVDDNAATSAVAEDAADVAVVQSQPAPVFVENAVFLKAIPANVTRRELLQHLETLDGFEKLHLSEPNKQRNFRRLAWAFFTSQSACQAAVDALERQQLTPNFRFQPIANDRAHTPRPRLVPSLMLSESRIEHDLQLCIQLVHALDTAYDMEKSNFLTRDSDEFLSSIEPTLRRLNVLQAYLRRVYHLCYYSGTRYVDEDEKRNRSSAPARRSKVAGNQEPPTVKSLAFAKCLDEKLEQLLETIPTLRPKDEEGNPIDPHELIKQEAMATFYERKVIKTDENKFRCGVCQKLFKGAEFVHKHLNKKHQPEINDAEQSCFRELYYRRFKADPERPRMPAPAAGSDAGASTRSASTNEPYFRGRDGPRSGGRGRARGSHESSHPPEHLKRRKLISYADLDAPDPDINIVSNSKIDYGLDDDDDVAEADEGEIRDNDDVDSS